MPTLQLFDSSVMIPWLRDDRYDDLVTAAFESKRFILSTVVWMELYAGTKSREDKRDLDQIVEVLSTVDRIVSPAPEDFYIASQTISYYIRRYGDSKTRDHTNDVLIILSAWRCDAELVAVNRQDMERWQSILQRSKRKVTLRVV